MKDLKYIYSVVFVMICFFLFPISSSAWTVTGNDNHPKSGVDSCVNDNTCMQVCEWDNGGYHVYAYYYFNGQWKYSWYYPYNPFLAEQTGSNLPTKNIFYQNNTIKNNLSNKGQCPIAAYVDQEGIGGNAELCFDTKETVKTDKKGNKLTYCHTKSGWMTQFKGSSKLVYNFSNDILKYFNQTALPSVDKINCNAIADSTGYAVDSSKLDSLLEQVRIDFSDHFLHGYPLNNFTFIQEPFQSQMERYKKRLNSKVEKCNEQFSEQAKEDLEDGKISEDEYDQAIEDGDRAEEEIKDKLDQLDKDIDTGKDENAKPIPITGTDCKSLLGAKTLEYLKNIFTMIQVVGVVLAVVLGMTDFIGALLSGENDSNKKSFKKFMIRVAMAAVLLIVPALLKMLFSTFGISGAGFCIL